VNRGECGDFPGYYSGVRATRRVRRLGRSFIVLATAASLAGCATGATWKPLDASSLRRSNAKALLLEAWPSDTLWADRGVPLGESAPAISMEGAKLQRDYKLVDPAPAIGAQLAHALAKEYGLDLVIVTEAALEGGRTLAPESAPRPATDLVLAVSTRDWGVMTAPRQWWRYVVHYEVRVTLTDARTGTMRANGTCTGDDPMVLRARKSPFDPIAVAAMERAPGWNELFAHDGEILKKEFIGAAERCLNRFWDKLFPGLPD
jgi:hypothetical protein